MVPKRQNPWPVLAVGGDLIDLNLVSREAELLAPPSSPITVEHGIQRCHANRFTQGND